MYGEQDRKRRDLGPESGCCLKEEKAKERRTILRLPLLRRDAKNRTARREAAYTSRRKDRFRNTYP